MFSVLSANKKSKSPLEHKPKSYERMQSEVDPIWLFLSYCLLPCRPHPVVSQSLPATKSITIYLYKPSASLLNFAYERWRLESSPSVSEVHMILLTKQVTPHIPGFLKKVVAHDYDFRPFTTKSSLINILCITTVSLFTSIQ